MLAASRLITNEPCRRHSRMPQPDALLSSIDWGHGCIHRHGLLDVHWIMNAEARLVELKLELPPAPKPMAVYRPVVIVGQLAYVSGHGPLKPDKTLILGRVD